MNSNREVLAKYFPDIKELRDIQEQVIDIKPHPNLLTATHNILKKLASRGAIRQNNIGGKVKYAAGPLELKRKPTAVA